MMHMDDEHVLVTMKVKTEPKEKKSVTDEKMEKYKKKQEEDMKSRAIKRENQYKEVISELRKLGYLPRDSNSETDHIKDLVFGKYYLKSQHLARQAIYLGFAKKSQTPPQNSGRQSQEDSDKRQFHEQIIQPIPTLHRTKQTSKILSEWYTRKKEHLAQEPELPTNQAKGHSDQQRKTTSPSKRTVKKSLVQETMSSEDNSKKYRSQDNHIPTFTVELADPLIYSFDLEFSHKRVKFEATCRSKKPQILLAQIEPEPRDMAKKVIELINSGQTKKAEEILEIYDLKMVIESKAM